MKKDIPFPTVQGVSIAITREAVEANEYFWNVYLMNQNKHAIHDITIRSKGYGEKGGQQQNTSTLRHHFRVLEAESSVLVEPIDPGVFHLYNEFWVSYFVEGQIFDKKFIFVPETIIEENLIFIPTINLQGILHS